MKKVLVTGGAGFIGSALVKELRNKKYDVYVIDNLTSGRKEFIPGLPPNNFFEIDILDHSELKRCFESINPSWVIHFAAIHFIPFCNENPVLATNVNIQGSLNVLDACMGITNLEKLLFASSAAVYPIMDGPISETVEPAPTDIYGLTKAIGEQIVYNFHKHRNIDCIICRFFNAFGPNETNPHLIPTIEKQIKDGVKSIKVGNLEPKRDYIYTEDLAEAVRILLENFSSGYDVFNIGMGSEFSVLEVIKAFENNLEKEILIEQDPSKMRKVDRLHLLADISKIRKNINWQPRVSISEGIALLINNN